MLGSEPPSDCAFTVGLNESSSAHNCECVVDGDDVNSMAAI